MSVAGMLPLPIRFLRGLRELCSAHGILLVFDEIFCGCGRTGDFWRMNNRIQPDICTLGKNLTGGLPAPVLHNRHRNRILGIRERSERRVPARSQLLRIPRGVCSRECRVARNVAERPASENSFSWPAVSGRSVSNEHGRYCQICSRSRAYGGTRITGRSRQVGAVCCACQGLRIIASSFWSAPSLAAAHRHLTQGDRHCGGKIGASTSIIPDQMSGQQKGLRVVHYHSG